MAKVLIYLENDESEASVEEMLIKAMTHHVSGGEHRETFHQPAAREVFEFMIREHDNMMDKLLKEIFEVLDEEV